MIRGRLFPLALVILTALLTFWLDQITRLSFISRDLDPDKPEFVAEGVKAVRFDAQGRALQRIQAERMWQYPNQHDILFETGQMHQYADGTLTYTVNAETGRYNNKTRIAFFEKQVRMTKQADSEHPAMIMDTTAMTLDTDKGFASSRTPVTMHYGNSVASSIGFTYDNHARLLNMLSNAKVTYEK